MSLSKVNLLLSACCVATSLRRGVYTTEQKWHGSDKNWKGSNRFCKETVKFYPFRVGSIGAYGPDTERIKVHCFFAKTVGTVPVFVGSVPFLFCRVNAPSITRSMWRAVLQLLYGGFFFPRLQTK